MKRIVYLENWQHHLVTTIEEVSERAGAYSASPERTALFDELGRLMELGRQVRDVTPLEREAVKSVVLPWTVKEPLQLPEELMQRLGDLFDIYRRFRTRLTWES